MHRTDDRAEDSVMPRRSTETPGEPAAASRTAGVMVPLRRELFAAEAAFGFLEVGGTATANRDRMRQRPGRPS